MNEVLVNKVAVVTGANRGLGAAIAKALAAAGAHVMLLARNEEGLRAVASEIESAGGSAAYFPIDVALQASAETAISATVARFGRIDILVNNAGIAEAGPSLDFESKQWERILAVNLSAPFYFCQAAGRRMAQQKSGKIINIASMFGLGGEPQLAAYCATKGALIQITRSLAVEWARYGIQVNAIAPGFFETDMTSADIRDEKLAPAMLRKIPSRRFGRPEELGPLAVYLASSASDFVTGETIVIDGGQRAR